MSISQTQSAQVRPGGTRLIVVKSVKVKQWFHAKVHLRWYGTLNMDQKVCLNMVKKDQLCAIALKKRN